MVCVWSFSSSNFQILYDKNASLIFCANTLYLVIEHSYIFFFFFFDRKYLTFIQNFAKLIQHVHTRVPLDWDSPPAKQTYSQHFGHAELTNGQGHSPAFWCVKNQTS